ncbi:fatty aldehyde dehydrogenase variant form [Tritrichomonas foetus]|uniref:Aldehyde dehydrogenase n=1 Tax=Tritrichomonas foetus TaxID=1144522 RepID=A0A1J4JWT0_9EUKA|nr:fatty aldehyde dehydrogenase variant form [Tritrichomonas foetus]|eukprot:OHT02912.1 fatty aldehyde dehydrogenase variant form [Tritrichomonas foetus]
MSQSSSSSSTSEVSDQPSDPEELDSKNRQGKDSQEATPSIAANIISQIGNESLAPHSVSPDQIPTIVKNLRDYFDTDVTFDFSWRKTQLKGLITILTKHEQHWVDAMYQDMGTHFFEAKLMIANIISEITDTLEHFEKWLKPEKRSNPWALAPGNTIVQPEPYGVVCDFIPYNYPMYLGFSTLIPIFAAGNVCLFKPSSNTPACAALYQRLFPRYLDPKGIAVVCGPTSICDVILKERFDFIFYTGSPKVGKLVMKAAAEHLTPVILELGGKSPVYFDDDVSLEKCTKRLLFGKNFNGGQTCVCPDYCLVNTKIWDKLLNCIKKVMTQFYGEPDKVNDNITKIINSRHYDRIVNAADNCGGEYLIKGFRSSEQKYIGPTVILNPALDSELMTEEIFGPVLPLIRVENANEAVKFIREREKPLAIYVMSQNSKVQKLFAEKTTSGALMYNDVVFHVSSANSPFGGVGNSGMGQYHGDVGVKSLSHMKPVINHKTTIDMEKRYPPYDLDNLNSLMKWI